MAMTLSIIYEDSDIVAINKSAGLTVHKTSPSDPQITLADLAVQQWPEMKGVGDRVNSPKGEHVANLRPGIVHRLDRDTSGVMLLAKTQKAFDYLKNLFQEHKIQKTYLALVYGAPKNSRGIIDSPVARIGAKTTTRIHGTRDLVERSAVTEYRTVQSFDGYTLLECMPKTGRTHQIRAHLKSLECPIVGDKLYSQNKPTLGLNRPFLHARRLEFISPSGVSMILEADLPQELEGVLSSLKSAGQNVSDTLE